jgi:hypothetical protein
MSVDKKILLTETAHMEGSPAVRETAKDEKRVLVVPSGPGNGNNKPKNILAGLSKEDLLSDVRTFATQKGLEEYLPELEKGALLAQRPDDFEEIAELDDQDRAAIRHERDHKWSHPLWLWLTIIICSTGEYYCLAFYLRWRPWGALYTPGIADTDSRKQVRDPLDGVSAPDSRKWRHHVAYSVDQADRLPA